MPANLIEEKDINPEHLVPIEQTQVIRPDLAASPAAPAPEATQATTVAFGSGLDTNIKSTPRFGPGTPSIPLQRIQSGATPIASAGSSNIATKTSRTVLNDAAPNNKVSVTRATVSPTTTAPLTLNNIKDSAIFGRVTQNALTTNSVDPSKSGVLAKGTNAVSLTNGFSYVASSGGSGTIYWNGMHLLRSDATVTLIGNGSQSLSGLTAGLNYYLYPYYSETTQEVGFVEAPASPATITGLKSSSVTLTGSYVTTASTIAGSTFVSNGFSIEGWVKMNGTDFFSDAETNLVGLSTSVSGSGFTGDFLAVSVGDGISNGGVVVISYWNGASMTNITITLTNTNLYDSNWHHICVGGTTVASYAVIDGQIYTGSGLSGWTSTGNLIWTIGAGPFGSHLPNGFMGSISCVALWNSATDFAANCQAGYNAMIAGGDDFFSDSVLATPTGAPDYFYRCNETSGTTIVDSSDSNNGTLQNPSLATLGVESSVIGVYGTPPIAWGLPNAIAAQLQNLQGLVPLTTSSLEIEIPASGSSGQAQKASTTAYNKGRFINLLT